MAIGVSNLAEARLTRRDIIWENTNIAAAESGKCARRRCDLTDWMRRISSTAAVRVHLTESETQREHLFPTTRRLISQHIRRQINPERVHNYLTSTATLQRAHVCVVFTLYGSAQIALIWCDAKFPTSFFAHPLLWGYWDVKCSRYVLLSFTVSLFFLEMISRLPAWGRWEVF